MTEGQYQIVRMSPDPVRDEPLNIGIVMTGAFSPLVAFPDDALERAAKWCRTLDPESLADLRDSLQTALQRASRRAEDLGSALRPDYLGERFGPITLSEPRWINVADDDPSAISELFGYLTDRIVRPPRPVSYVGGTAPAIKLAKEILPVVRQVFPNARANEQLLGHSGRPFIADVFAPGPQPLVMATMVPSSSWQGLRGIEAKAFELSDVARAMKTALLAVCCTFPAIDPEGVRNAAESIFRSIDATVVTPENLSGLRRPMSAATG